MANYLVRLRSPFFLNETSLKKKGEDINANKIINIKYKLIIRESSSK